MRVDVEIRRRVGQRGAITFAEFMELALFWPDGGYYLAGNPIGASGDYYTSPHVHPAFGALLAVQLFQMWQLLEKPDPFTVLELGAGAGLLCRDIVARADHLPGAFASSLRYISQDLRAVQGVERAHEERSPGADVCRVAASGVPYRNAVGCILSNEFLDALPVHQVVLRQHVLQEVYVTLNGGEYGTTLGELSTPALAARLESLEIQLQDGQTAEICLALDSLVQQAANSLAAGYLLSLDYGHPAAELYSPERKFRGTLTTFYRHTQLDAPFRHIGHQDITAQVDFTSVVSAGKRHGLDPVGFTTQAQFLRNLGLSRLQQRLAGMELPQNAAIANRTGMVELARTGGLGDFKVLVQGKGVSKTKPWGFEKSSEVAELVEDLPVPLLTDQHLSLPRGRYPNSELEFDRHWTFDDVLSGPEELE